MHAGRWRAQRDACDQQGGHAHAHTREQQQQRFKDQAGGCSRGQESPAARSSCVPLLLAGRSRARLVDGMLAQRAAAGAREPRAQAGRVEGVLARELQRLLAPGWG